MMASKDGVVAEVEGLEHLTRQMRALPDRVQNNILRSAVQSGAQEMVKEIRRRAPRGRKVLSSRSINSLRYGPMRKSIKAKRRSVKDGVVGSSIYMGKAFYWRFFEFGTKKMAARPFVRPAIEATQPIVLRSIMNKLWRNLDNQISKQRVKR